MRRRVAEDKSPNPGQGHQHGVSEGLQAGIALLPVNPCGIAPGMAEHVLYRSDAGPIVEKVCGEGPPEVMRRDLEPQPSAQGAKPVADLLACEGKHPVGRPWECAVLAPFMRVAPLERQRAVRDTGPPSKSAGV